VIAVIEAGGELPDGGLPLCGQRLDSGELAAPLAGHGDRRGQAEPDPTITSKPPIQTKFQIEFFAFTDSIRNSHVPGYRLLPGVGFTSLRPAK
jgi:hypothetical protein